MNTDPKAEDIWLIDDDVDVMEGFAINLKDRFVVRTFNSAAAALEVLRTGGAPRLIISDLKMPKMSGIEFVEALRGQKNGSPVMFVSGYATKPDVVRALNLGVVGFLEKPFTVDRLFDAIDGAVKTPRVIDPVEHVYLIALIRNIEALNDLYFERLSKMEKWMEHNNLSHVAPSQKESALESMRKENLLHRNVSELKQRLGIV